MKENKQNTQKSNKFAAFNTAQQLLADVVNNKTKQKTHEKRRKKEADYFLCCMQFEGSIRIRLVMHSYIAFYGNFETKIMRNL